MARPLRVELTGAVYHVIARGNERRAVFRDDRDREIYLERLAECRERFQLRVLAYCLMNNHVHVAVERGPFPLSRVMLALQSFYAQRFNRRHRRSGHLFPGTHQALEGPDALRRRRGVVAHEELARDVEEPEGGGEAAQEIEESRELRRLLCRVHVLILHYASARIEVPSDQGPLTPTGRGGTNAVIPRSARDEGSQTRFAAYLVWDPSLRSG